MSIGFQMPGIKTVEHMFHRTPGLVIVGFRHDHQETLRLHGGGGFLKDTIFIVTSSGWISVLISVLAGTLVLMRKLSQDPFTGKFEVVIEEMDGSD